MSMLRWMGLTFARFVGLAVTILGAWIAVGRLTEGGPSGEILVWIIGSGLLGVVGGLTYLLSLDGPDRFRSRRARVLGWMAMLVSVLLPTSLRVMLVLLVLLVSPTLFMAPAPTGGSEEPVTSE